MVTEEELSDARADYAEVFLVARCDIHRAQEGDPSGYGGREHGLKLVAHNVPCRASRPGRPQVIEEGSRPTALADWEIMLPVGTSVAYQDTITIGTDQYEVLGSNAGIAEALATTVYCQRKL